MANASILPEHAENLTVPAPVWIPEAHCWCTLMMVNCIGSIVQMSRFDRHEAASGPWQYPLEMGALAAFRRRVAGPRCAGLASGHGRRASEIMGCHAGPDEYRRGIGCKC
jgi:hypothetical protein